MQYYPFSTVLFCWWYNKITIYFYHFITTLAHSIFQWLTQLVVTRKLTNFSINTTYYTVVAPWSANISTLPSHVSSPAMIVIIEFLIEKSVQYNILVWHS